MTKPNSYYWDKLEAEEPTYLDKYKTPLEITEEDLKKIVK